MRGASTEEHILEFNIKAIARVLKVSRSGFYTWHQRKGKPSFRQQQREARDAEIKVLLEAGKGVTVTFGQPKIWRK